MKLALLLIVMLIPNALFGASYDDEWPIYVYGNASYYKLIYDGIALIVQDDTFIKPMFTMVFLASSLFAAKSFTQSNLSGALWNTAVGMGIVGMALFPTSTVHVLDVRTLNGYVYPDTGGTGDFAGYQKVDNIPFYLAAVPSVATSLKYHIINSATDVLTPIDGGSLRDSGFGTPMSLAEDMISVSDFKYSKDDAYTAPTFQQDLSHYTEKCLVEEVLYVDKDAIFGIMNPKGQQLDALAPDNFTAQNLSAVEIVDRDNNPTTCGQFWNNNIQANQIAVGNTLYQNLKDKNPKMDMDKLAEATASVAGIESNATLAITDIKNAMVNIATTGTLLGALEKAGTGLSGIDLSNSITAKQSLYANTIDSTGQFRWMIKVIPVIEFLIFGILIFLGIAMAVVAGISGVQKGGKMLMNYAFGLVAFSFIDVALAIVQAVSLFYYKDKMAEAMIMLGQNPFTASNIPLYLQEMSYMSGMMGLASVIVVPLVVGVVFKGETAAAAGAFNAVSSRYKGDGAGKNAEDSLGNATSIHASEAEAYEEYARRNLADYGIPVPIGALASQKWEEVSAQAGQYGNYMGTHRASGGNSLGDFSGERANAGMGTGMQKVTAEIANGQGLLESINKNANNLENFAHQTRTDAMAGFEATANKGRFAQNNEDFNRDAQISAATVNAIDSMVKSVKTADGLKSSMGYNDDGSIDNQKEFGKYAEGLEINSRIQANKIMGAGAWALDKSEQEKIDAMSDIQRVGAMGIASEVAKGDAFQKGKYKGDLDRYESDLTDIETSKSDSMFGQAKGVRNNRLAGVDYADNAEFGEMSKQQSIKAKLDTQGGVENAVAYDVKDASIKAAQQMGTTDGLLSAIGNKEAIKGFVEEAYKQAKADGRGDAFKSDLQKAGLMDADGNVQPENWVSGRAFLQANNMNSHNALMAGGAVFSGALGADGKATVKMDAQDSYKSGMALETGGDVNSAIAAYKTTHNGAMPTLPQLAEFINNSQMAESSRKNLFGHLAATIASATGQDADTVEKELFLGGSALGGIALNSIIGNPGGKGISAIKNTIKGSFGFNNGSADTFNSESLKDGTAGTMSSHAEEYAEHKKAYDKEKHNNEMLKKKKWDMLNKNPGELIDTRDINMKIKESDGRLSEIDKNMRDSDTAYRHAKHEKMKAMNGGKGFWKGRFDAVEDALDGGGSWKTKLGLATSAMILGSASDTFAQTLEAIDPTSYAMGSPISKLSDLDYAMANGQMKAMSGTQSIFSQPTGFNTMQAIQQDQVANSQMASANNIETIASIVQARSGGFSMTDGGGNNVSFTTGKGDGHNLMVNGNDTGTSYQQFSSLMQNGQMAAQFSDAIASSDFNNKDAYNTTNQLLQDMTQAARVADMRQRVHNNATATNSQMQHKEILEAQNEKKEKVEQF